MKTTVTKNDFIKAFENRNNFTRKGLINLFNYFEEIELEDDVELDVIAICCEYTEYCSIQELKECYNIPFVAKKAIKKYLEEKTTVLSFEDDSIIIRDFKNK